MLAQKWGPVTKLGCVSHAPHLRPLTTIATVVLFFAVPLLFHFFSFTTFPFSASCLSLPTHSPPVEGLAQRCKLQQRVYIGTRPPNAKNCALEDCRLAFSNIAPFQHGYLILWAVLQLQLTRLFQMRDIFWRAGHGRRSFSRLNFETAKALRSIHQKRQLMGRFS